jgi:hypothetical protein
MINRYDIVKNIEELGEQILKELAPNEFRLFAERTKLYVDNAFDEYLRQVEDEVLSSFVEEDNKKKAFMDLETGFMRQMQLWLKDNAIAVTEQNVDINKLKSDSKKQKRSLYTILGGGTLLAIGLSIPAKIAWWVPVVVELLTLGAAYKKYNSSYITPRQIQMKIYTVKKELINGVINDIESWLDSAEKQITIVKESFDLKMHI